MKWSFLLIALLLASSGNAIAQDETPTAARQIPNISQLPDVTAKLQGQIDQSRGTLSLAAGDYRISSSLVFSLKQKSSAQILGKDGKVRLIMDGPGPAIRIVGSHKGTASPSTFEAATWNESAPLIQDIEIIGNHIEADGVALSGTVQPILTRVAIRWCRHGIHFLDRNRNVVVSDCHLYENRGVGIYFDNVNIHQANITNCHVSYNRAGGIVIREGNIRNVQISNCDLEANMPGDDTPTETANILIDVSAEPDSRTSSIAEIAITGCTIQHSSNYGGKKFESIAPGGANIRILGKAIWPVDSVSITGNIISDTSLNVDFAHCMDITFTGNTLFAPNPDNLRARHCKRLIVNGNTWNPRQFERPGRLIFENCEDSIVSNNTFHALLAEDGAIQLHQCRRMNLLGNILTKSKSGISLKNSKEIRIKDWTVSGLPDGKEWIQADEASSYVNE